MLRDRRLLVSLSLCFALLVGGSSATHGAFLFGLKATVASVSGDIAYVRVTNNTNSTQTGTVSVVALGASGLTTGTATVTLAAGQSSVIAVRTSGPVQGAISLGIVTEDTSPV